MSKLTAYSPAASCAMASGALALALLGGAVELRMLQAAMTVTSAALTMASFVSAIIGIVAFRRGPRRQTITAWIGSFRRSS